MANWEWKPSGDISSNIQIAESYEGVDGVQPAPRIYPKRGAIENVTLSAHLLTFTEFLAEKAKGGTEQTFTAAAPSGESVTFTGYVSRVSFSYVDGTGLYDVTVTLLIPYEELT